MAVEIYEFSLNQEEAVMGLKQYSHRLLECNVSFQFQGIRAARSIKSGSHEAWFPCCPSSHTRKRPFTIVEWLPQSLSTILNLTHRNQNLMCQWDDSRYGSQNHAGSMRSLASCLSSKCYVQFDGRREGLMRQESKAAMAWLVRIAGRLGTTKASVAGRILQARMAGIRLQPGFA